MASLLNDPKLLNQATKSASSTPDLNDFTYYNNRSYGGIGAEEVGTDKAQNMLTNLRKYDPNAQFTPTYGSDGTSLQGYQLQFDPSKLPGAGKTGALGGSNPSDANAGHYAGGSGYMPRFSTVQEHMNLANPNAVGMSDHYGKITDNRNIYDKPALLDTLGPLAVGGFGALAGGAGALASMLQKAPGMIGSAVHGNFNPFQLASAALPYVPGVNPFMATLGKIGLNYAGGH